jgi:3',5'-cyclic AMP phosphodiesterase CpdA
MMAIARRASDPGMADKPLVIAQHHPPFLRGSYVWQWIDGLRGSPRLMAVLEATRHVFVMHGHLHMLVNRSLGGSIPRILGATAAVEDRGAPRVRLFDARDCELVEAQPPIASGVVRESWPPYASPLVRPVGTNLEVAV